MLRALGVVSWLALASCDVLGGGGLPDANPPADPPPDALPQDLVDALPRTADDLPIVTSTHAFGSEVQVAYDVARDDAIARWGQCLSRVAACHRANPGAAIAGCIDQIERCPDDSGGPDCCPPRCISDFLEQYDATGNEESAISSTFLHGACVEGFPAEEVTP